MKRYFKQLYSGRDHIKHATIGTLLITLLALASLNGCALHKPRTNTAAPSLGSARHSIEDAKDILSERSQEIDDELAKLEKELQ